MTEIEYLLCSIGEEGVEVSQRSSKAQRFGLHEVQEDQDGLPLDNAERLIYEFNDLYTLLCILREQNPSVGSLIRPELVKAKREKYKKYLDYAKDIGTVTT